MNADGSGQTNLTKSPANESGPAWSPMVSPLHLLQKKMNVRYFSG